MTTAALEPELESDPYLITLVRGGDSAAFGLLYQRHVQSATRLARVLVRDPADVDDLVAETFAKVLAALRAGGGPDTAFRAYVLTTLRHTMYDRLRRDRRVEFTDDPGKYEIAEIPADPTIERLESSYAARAFARLPERWRAVLWHTEVEGESPAQVAPLLGLTPNGVAALAYRARERLRQMYLQEHITITGSPRCHWTGDHLGGYVRANIARRDRDKVEDHLSECAECRRLHRELTEENAGLRGVLAPLLLGAAAPGYLGVTAKTGAGIWLALHTGLIAWWHGFVADMAVIWHWILGVPRWLQRKYGRSNAAAVTGIVAACLAGLLAFGVVLVSLNRTEPPPGPDALPLPAPVVSQAVPSPLPTTLPSFEPEPEPEPSTVTVTKKRPVLASALDGATLTSGQRGVLAVPVRVAENREESAPAKLSLEVDLPKGIRLAGSDAGEGWSCSTRGKVACERAMPRVGEQTTARIPVNTDATLSGFQTVEVSSQAGQQRTKSVFRVPVAPASMRVGHSVIGRVGFAVAGNALLACRPRPACLKEKDNNALAMQPLLPAAGEPSAPRGLTLTGPLVASGARIGIPKGAKVRWAGLNVSSSASRPPSVVALHGPGGSWSSVRLDRGGSADVSKLMKGSGDWWVAAAAGSVPAGVGQYAGWSLTVIYETATAGLAELAVYLGPKDLHEKERMSLHLSGAGPTEVGVVLWDGDRNLRGDTLAVGGAAVGDPQNIATGANESATALACSAAQTGCSWRTPGMDVSRYRSAANAAGDMTLAAGGDPLEVGVLVVSTQR